MAKRNWTESEESLLATCKNTLESIITEWSAEPEPAIDIDSIDAEADLIDKEGNPITTSFKVPIRPRNRIMVDDAIAELWLRLVNRKGVDFGEVETYERVEREAYHLAVDAYFRIYRGSRKRGRPPLPQSLLRQMLELKKAGMSPEQIASATSLDPQKKGTKDRVRKRIEIAEERLSQAGKNSPE